MSDHRLRLRAALLQARIARFATAAARCTRQAGWASQATRWAMFNATALVNRAVLFGGSGAASSYTVTSDCAQFRLAS